MYILELGLHQQPVRLSDRISWTNLNCSKADVTRTTKKQILTLSVFKNQQRFKGHAPRSKRWDQKFNSCTQLLLLRSLSWSYQKKDGHIFIWDSERDFSKWLFGYIEISWNFQFFGNWMISGKLVSVIFCPSLSYNNTSDLQSRDMRQCREEVDRLTSKKLQWNRMVLFITGHGPRHKRCVFLNKFT